jgi:hypothetical protein
MFATSSPIAPTPPLPGPLVPLVPDQERPDRPGVDRLLHAGPEIGPLGIHLREVLNLPALVAVLPIHRDRMGIARTGDHGVDPVPLAERPGLEDPFVGEVMLQQAGHVDQIAAVGVAADQVPAADQPADRQLANPAPGQLGRRCLRSRSRPRLHPAGNLRPRQQPMFLDTHHHRGGQRSGQRTLQKPTTRERRSSGVHSWCRFGLARGTRPTTAPGPEAVRAADHPAPAWESPPDRRDLWGELLAAGARQDSSVGRWALRLWVESNHAARGRPGRFARPRPPTSPVPRPSPIVLQPRLPWSRRGSARHPKRAGRPRAGNLGRHRVPNPRGHFPCPEISRL